VSKIRAMQRARCASWPLVAVAAAAFPGCVTSDDGRVQQLLNQRGFGTRYVGDTNNQYYIGIGDVISISDPLNVEFTDTLKVRTDGVIDPPVIKEIFVAGLTVPDLEEMLTLRYREYNTTADISAVIVTSASKWYYIDGEVGRAGRIPFEGETTLFRAVFDAVPSILSDDDAIRLIRPDPYHPLVVEFDYDDMLEGGWSLGNVEVRENDIIYVPPNLFGYLTIFTEQLFSPLSVIVTSALGINRLIYSVDTFGDTDRFQGRGRNGFFGRVTPAGGEPLQVASETGGAD
jgi:polysaccharide biosynthesis/export protein